MSTPPETVPPAPHPSSAFGEAAARRHWLDHAARTTAVLAVLAAVSSGQYANQFSRTILAQAEASDQWSYYQAKSIKRHIVAGQVELIRAMAKTRPEAAAEITAVGDADVVKVKEYEVELGNIKKKAEDVEAEKNLHQKQGNWFQGAFIILQAGVVLSTIAASSKRKELWAVAIACGLAGLAVVAYGFWLGMAHG